MLPLMHGLVFNFYEEIARLITTNDYEFVMIDEPEATEKHLEE